MLAHAVETKCVELSGIADNFGVAGGSVCRCVDVCATGKVLPVV